jgi:acetyltransferase-like isoleucine patch superfamily enzyme
MNVVGQLFLAAYRSSHRLRQKCFSLLIAGAFAEFGRKSSIMYPVRLTGESRIAIGDKVTIGSGSWLQTLPDGDNRAVAISIGAGTSIAGTCVISAVRSVVLEENVLLARNVYISDHIHRYTDTDRPIVAQGLDKIRAVRIKGGAWLGQNVVVCPGVTIGLGAVVGANSVVNDDVPDFAVAVGSPAKVVKSVPVRTR